MFKFTEKIELLRNIKAPEDLVDSDILNNEHAKLYLETLFEELRDHPLNTETAIYRPPKSNFKKNVKNVWDVDIKHSGPGYFDHEGNFILDKPIKNSNSWFIKEGESIKGPFNDKEIEDFIKSIGNRGSLIFLKRDFDKGFVNLKEILSVFPSLPNSVNFKELNKYFMENQIIEKKDSVDKDDFFEETFVFEKNTRLTNFLRTHNICASIGYIIKSITNKKKAHAIDLVQRITGLDKSVNSALIDLIVESAGKQILLDVDKDGFTINFNDRRRK